MIVIIDGYNLLKQIFPGIKGELSKQRNYLIQQLGIYKKYKSDDIKSIILVFDAGPFRHASREVHKGIEVIFSGQNSIADEWILNYVQKHKNEEILLITKDRELILACKNFGIDVLGVHDFYDIVQNTILKEVQSSDTVKNDDLHKYEIDDELLGKINPQSLDLLMNQYSMYVDKKKENEGRHVKKGKSEALSKKEKKFYKKIKKL